MLNNALKSSSESPEKQTSATDTASGNLKQQQQQAPLKGTISNLVQNSSTATNNSPKSVSLNGSAKNLFNFSNSDLYEHRHTIHGTSSGNHSHHHNHHRLSPSAGISNNDSFKLSLSTLASRGSANNLNSTQELENQVAEEEEAFDGLIYRDTVNANQTLSMLNVLRKNRQLCDLILQLDDDTQDIYCHQIILACNSKFFMEIFNNYELEQANASKVSGGHSKSSFNGSSSTGSNDNGASAAAGGENSGDEKLSPRGPSHKKNSLPSLLTRNHNCSQKQLVFCLSDSLKNFLNDDYHHHYAKISSIINHNSHYNHYHYSNNYLNHHMDSIADQQNEDVHNMNHNLDYEALRTCIDYIYTSKLKVPSYLLPHVYTLAYHLSFDSIVNACSQHLINHLNADNCLSIRSFALDENLIQCSTECIERNIEYILQLNQKLNVNTQSHQYSSNTSLSSLSAAKQDAQADQNNQDQVTLTSSINLAHKEFNHLPRVNIELVGLPVNKTKLPDNIVVLTQMCMSWLVDELVERKYLQTAAAEINGSGGGQLPVTPTSAGPQQLNPTTVPHHQSLTELCDNVNMLYMNNGDNTLHDCVDMDSANANFNDHINDYQKRYHNNNVSNNNNNNNNPFSGNCSNGACATQSAPAASSSSGSKHRISRFKSFKITDQELNAIGMATPIKLKVLHDNEIICTYQLSESTFITICTLTGKLVTLSVHILPAYNSGEEGGVDHHHHHQNQTNGNKHLLNVINEPSISTNHKRSFDGNSGDHQNPASLLEHQHSLMVSSTVSTGSGSNDNLERLPKMNTPRCSHGSVAHENKLYMIGGYDRGECLSLCEIYDPVTNTLEEIKPMHCRRGRAAVTWFSKDRSIYVIGGSDGHEDLNSLEHFNTETREWRLIKFDYQLACTNLGAIACENFIYLVGLKNEKNSARTICLKYDPMANRFTRLANLNSGRSQSALVWLQTTTSGLGTAGFFLYVFGGYDQYRCLSSCEVYNIAEDKWSVIPSMRENRRGCGAAYHEASQSIYIVGGTNGSQSLRSVEIYDVRTKTWRAGPELNMARTNVAIAFTGDVLFAIGGFDGKSFLKTIEYLNCKSTNDGWSLYYKPSDFDHLIHPAAESVKADSTTSVDAI